MYELTFESKLCATKEQVWQWITSTAGITQETMPFLRMTFPKGTVSLTQATVQPGKRLCRSYLLFLGFIPFDYSDLTLMKIEPLVGFIEQSPMGTMKFWQHIRTIRVLDNKSVILKDELTFQPRIFGTVVCWITKYFFQHRHKILRKKFLN